MQENPLNSNLIPSWPQPYSKLTRQERENLSVCKICRDFKPKRWRGECCKGKE